MVMQRLQQRTAPTTDVMMVAHGFLQGNEGSMTSCREWFASMASCEEDIASLRAARGGTFRPSS